MNAAEAKSIANSKKEKHKIEVALKSNTLEKTQDFKNIIDKIKEKANNGEYRLKLEGETLKNILNEFGFEVLTNALQSLGYEAYETDFLELEIAW